MIKTRGLAFKLSLLFTAVCGAILCVLILLYYNYTSHLLLKNVDAQAQQLLNATAKELERYFMPVKTVPDSLVYFMEHSVLPRERIPEVLSDTVDSNPGIFGVGLAFDPDVCRAGMKYCLFYSERKNGKAHVSWLGDGKLNYFTYDWYQIARETGQAQWSEPYVDHVNGNVTMVTYAVPFYRPENGVQTFKGVAAADVSIDQIAHEISSIKVLKTGYAFLVSKNGTYIAHPKRELIMDETIFTVSEMLGDPKLRSIGLKMMAGQTGMALIKNVMTGKPSRLYYTPVKATGWSLAVVFPEDEYLEDINTLNEIAAGIGLLGLLLHIVAISIIVRSIVRPLSIMSAAAENIADGNLDAPLPPISSNDEVGDLARSFESMRKDLKQYISTLQTETASRERLESELRIARDIQMSFLPKSPNFVPGAPYALHAGLEPARAVGGDLYDFFELPGDRLFFVIGDVSDKGVPAALFMAVTKALIKSVVMLGVPDPAEILARANAALVPDNRNMMFVSVFCGIIDLKTGLLRYSNGGHLPPLLLSGNKAVSLDMPPGKLLGIDASAKYKSLEVTMNPGDSLVLYTDGVTEAADESGNFFGDDRLSSLAEGLSGKKPDEVVSGVFGAVHAFAGKAPQSDDIAVLCLSYRGASRSAEIRFMSDERGLLDAMSATDSFVSGCSLPQDKADDVRLVVEELATNKIKYAFGDGRTHEVRLTLACSFSEVTITVEDDGDAFNPLEASAPDVSRPPSERPIGGLGIKIIKSLCGKIEYERREGKNRFSAHIEIRGEKTNGTAD